MADRYNERPISLREGHVYLDGVEVMDSIKCSINITPDVWKGKLLGERTDSRRWLGAEITGSMTRRRTTPFYNDKVKHYLQTGETPEFTIQGIMDDENSDYYERYGSDTVTVVGCVLTGDIPLLSLDSGGQVVEDTVAFDGKDIV